MNRTQMIEERIKSRKKIHQVLTLHYIAKDDTTEGVGDTIANEIEFLESLLKIDEVQRDD